jgi:Niemann-Pick C1 protein
MQVKVHLPWFLVALPSEDCAKGGAGAYTDALQLSSKESTGIKVVHAAVPGPCFSLLAPLFCASMLLEQQQDRPALSWQLKPYSGSIMGKCMMVQISFLWGIQF